MGLSAGTVGAASIGAQSFGSVFGGITANKSAKYNAAISEQNAVQDEKYASQAGELGNIEAANSEEQTREKLAGVKANQGASGVTIGKGSSADVQASVAQTGMLDAMTIRSNAARQAYGYQVEAVNERAHAQVQKSEGKNALISGIMGGATTALGGYAKGVQTGTFKDPWAQYQSGRSISSPEETYLIENHWS